MDWDVLPVEHLCCRLSFLDDENGVSRPCIHGIEGEYIATGGGTVKVKRLDDEYLLLAQCCRFLGRDNGSRDSAEYHR